MLRVKGLNVAYGAIKAIHNVSFEVRDGEIVSLIGANGAGKTTILHTITGLKTATEGTIHYNDLDLRATDASKLIRYGIGHVPEGRHIFPDMTVMENLEMGAYSLKKRESNMADDLSRVFESFPRLKERRKQLAGTLSGGEQQMLAMGRTLIGKPKLLLLDEPSMGLSPILVKEIFRIIKFCHESGITILLVEQNAKMALNIADCAYVLENGTITISGDAKQLLLDDRVRKAYLGQ